MGGRRLSAAPEQRLLDQRLDHGNHVQLDLEALPEVVLVHDGVLEAELELHRPLLDGHKTIRPERLREAR